LVTGAVLFTLLVQGLTMPFALRKLTLDRPPLADQLALLEREIIAHQKAILRLPAVMRGGLFSSRVSHRIKNQSQKAIDDAKQAIHQLRDAQLSPDLEFHLFFLRALTEEKSYYRMMFDRGHLSEPVTRRLLAVLERQTDSLRYNRLFPDDTRQLPYDYVGHRIFTLFASVPFLNPVIERIRRAHISHYYETVLGHSQGSRHVLHSIDQLAQIESTPQSIVARVQEHYEHWNKLATDKLYRLNHDFPEFALLIQEQLGKRVVLLAEIEITREQALHGTIPTGAAQSLETRLLHQLKALRGQTLEKLTDNPEQLIKRVPLFSHLPPHLIGLIANACKPVTLEQHDYLIHQGSQNDTLYIVTRGTVSMQRYVHGKEERLSTLIAGDSFGESALLGEGHADVSVIAQTPSQLITLQRSCLLKMMDKNSELHALLTNSDALQRSIHRPGAQDIDP
ncbi:MAG TPA: cyclic nucleotide-binding domain-containing protein, partial [Marinobacter sp.]|nr:cyclic nucleotide-binding domain-containing protein [Marinobacter sp.]